MKIKLGQLKRIIREAVMNEARVMTPEEAGAKCAELNLDPKTTTFIVKQFAESQNVPAVARSHHGPYAGTEGRIGWGQSWEGVMEDLAVAMGKEPDAGLYGDDPEIEQVFNTFFQE